MSEHDPLEEIRTVREKLAKDSNYDVHKIASAARERELLGRRSIDLRQVTLSARTYNLFFKPRWRGIRVVDVLVAAFIIGLIYAMATSPK